MPNYSSWKVTDLKAELKKRGIPQTGLRLKQHFIDKLVEQDSKDEAAEAPAAAPTAPEPELPQEKPSPETTSPHAQPEQEQAPPTQEQEAQQCVDQHAEQLAQQSEVAAETQPQQVEDGAEPIEESKQEQPEPSDQTAKDTTPQALKAPEFKAEEPAEQAAGDEAQKLTTDESERGESAKPARESVPPASQISEPNTSLSTPLPLEEVLEDTRKRKRRSQSPVPIPEASANKKARAKEESPVQLLKDDEGSVSRDEGARDYTSEERKDTRTAPAKQDPRFRDLFPPAKTAPLQPAPPSRDQAIDDVKVEPARHAATAALYVDGLMRPLQPEALRQHLVSLASSPGAGPNADVIRDFYLDPIKTHCFVSFADMAAASRVRSALHGTVWPNERIRKNLGVDFIPEHKIEGWIRAEEESRDRLGPPPRWEVRYEQTGNGITAVLAEVRSGSRPAPTRPREAGFNRTPPLGPRHTSTQTEAPPLGLHRTSTQTDTHLLNAPPPAPTSSRPGQGFKPLDELFESTTTKPKLYYLPVPRRVADKRLDQFDELLHKGSFPRRGGYETRRITFEDEDYFVDIGPEYGARAQRRRQARGGRPGGSWRT